MIKKIIVILVCAVLSHQGLSASNCPNPGRVESCARESAALVCDCCGCVVRINAELVENLVKHPQALDLAAVQQGCMYACCGCLFHAPICVKLGGAMICLGCLDLACKSKASLKCATCVHDAIRSVEQGCKKCSTSLRAPGHQQME